MKTSGIILDLYDDVNGSVLKSFYPRAEDIPVFVKQASALPREKLDALPDDLFALVINGDDYVMRKYACHDSGNAALSVMYFLNTAHMLPQEAQKIAAANLIKACDMYNIEIPEDLTKIASGAFEKVALGLGTVMTAISLPGQIKTTGQEIKSNLDASKRVRQATGNPIVTPQQMKHMKTGEARKFADVAQTHLMPLQQPMRARRQFVPKKTAEANFMRGVIGSSHQDVDPDVNFEIEGDDEQNPERAPQVKLSGRLTPWFQAHGEAPKFYIEKRAHQTALPGRYPLDDYKQVKTAATYFNEYQCRFSPAERHEYCKNLVKRASQLGIKLNNDIRKYGSASYAPYHEFAAAIDVRHQALTDPYAHKLLDKLAEARPYLHPDRFCATLEEFDKVAGLDHLWDRHVFDPYFSTYGFEKTAEDKLEEFADVIGNLRVTGPQLELASRASNKSLRAMFGDDFADEFWKDPVAIYKSMPREQKIIIINMAQEAENGS